MLLILAFLALTGSLVIVGKLVTQPARDRQASLRRAGSYASTEGLRSADPLAERLERRYGSAAARLARRLDPRLTDDRIAHKLLASGMARSMTPNGFLGLKIVLGAAGVVAGGLVGVLFFTGPVVLLLAAAFAVVGFLVPDWIANNKAAHRRNQIRRELPDALDILAVSVEAGLGFEEGLAKLSENMRGPLVDELSIVLGELRVGEARSVTLRRMSDRVDLPEITSVVNSLIQAEQLGSPLGRMLRVQAQESRHRRQIAAEERAMKAPVKMLIPTVLFIIPAMYVVILGPALISITETF